MHLDCSTLIFSGGSDSASSPGWTCCNGTRLRDAVTVSGSLTSSLFLSKALSNHTGNISSLICHCLSPKFFFFSFFFCLANIANTFGTTDKDHFPNQLSLRPIALDTLLEPHISPLPQIPSWSSKANTTTSSAKRRNKLFFFSYICT